MKPSRILILYADAGFGHRSAARSIKSALEEKYSDQCLVDMINPLEDERAPFYLRDIQTDYDKIVKSIPDLYRLGYEVSNRLVPSIVIETALIPMLYDVMKDLLQRLQPDVIVTTYPAYQSPLDAVFTLTRTSIPLVTVVTDLVDVHQIWFNVGAERWMVPTEAVRQQAVRSGLPEAQVVISGIPVSTDIAHEKREKAQIRAEMGLDPDRFIVLVTGSKRVTGLPQILEGLNHSGHPLELALVAGGDEDLYQQMRDVDWHLPVRIHNYVNFIPALMHASDALVCKAGGLIVSEALAAGLPMMLMDVLPGQETGNAEYVITNGAGEMAETSQQLLEITAHWLQNDRQIWKLRQRKARSVGRADAGYTVADEVMRLTNTEIPPMTIKHLFKRSHLVQILKQQREALQKRSDAG